MKRRTILGSLLSAAAFGSCLGAPAPARAEVTSNVRFPTSIHTTNLCNGEELDLPIEMHFVSSVTENAAGGSTAVIHMNAKGSGVGSFGNNYQVMEVDRLVGTAIPLDDGSGQKQFTDTLTFRAIGQGSVPNILIHTLMHFTFNADGVLTAIVLQFETECSNG